MRKGGQLLTYLLTLFGCSLSVLAMALLFNLSENTDSAPWLHFAAMAPVPYFLAWTILAARPLSQGMRNAAAIIGLTLLLQALCSAALLFLVLSNLRPIVWIGFMAAVMPASGLLLGLLMADLNHGRPGIGAAASWRRRHGAGGFIAGLGLVALLALRCEGPVLAWSGFAVSLLPHALLTWRQRLREEDVPVVSVAQAMTAIVLPYAIFAAVAALLLALRGAITATTPPPPAGPGKFDEMYFLPPCHLLRADRCSPQGDNRVRLAVLATRIPAFDAP